MDCIDQTTLINTIHFWIQYKQLAIGYLRVESLITHRSTRRVKLFYRHCIFVL